MRKRTLLVVWMLATSLAVGAEPETLDQLLDAVAKQRSAAKQVNAEREQRFLAERDNQAALLAEAKAKLAAEEARGEELKTTYALNEQTLAARRDALRGASGELGEFQGVVPQL